jgi:uncharacterized protein
MARVVGLLADTHVPYRAAEISPAVIEALNGVDLILHAGDVDEPWALKSLEAVAPVYAVRGNYHLFDRSSAGRELPESIELDLEGYHVAVTHGHQIGFTAWFWKGWMTLQYLMGKWHFPQHDRLIVRKLLRRFPRADVIVFGHTHRFYRAWQEDVLVINPGAALHTSYFGSPLVPSIAHLVLARGEPPEVRRINLGS